MESAYTGPYIRKVMDDVLAEWEIHHIKVRASLTDNGSNMVAAFRVWIQALDNEEDDLKEKTEEQQESEEIDKNTDFEDWEFDQEIAFCLLGHISCFSHTLQLVVNKISEIAAFKGILNHAHTLLQKVNSSVKATEISIFLSGKKLVRDCPMH